MRRRTAHVLIRTFVPVVLVAALAGCGERASGSSPTPSSGPPGDPDAPIALVLTDDGLAGVRVGTSDPLWTAPGAVASPDGAAVFATRAADDGGLDLVRIDPETGTATVAMEHIPDPAGMQVAAVEPLGARVIMAAPGDGDTTLVVILDPSDTASGPKQVFEGTLEPEALSLDRQLVFAARIYPDRYHVHVLTLADGTQYPTLGPDKSAPPEDMYGQVVQAVLSPDRRQLATLYRDDRSPDHTGFVHLLSLEFGQTVCIDLHAPFGTGGAGTDAIEWRSDGTVAVGHTAADPADSLTASFDPEAIWSGEPQPHYHADAEADRDPPALPAGVADVAGFRRFIALATAP